MSAIVLPMRGQEPGLATLVEQIVTGVVVYAVVVLGFDVAGLRSITIARLRLTVARMRRCKVPIRIRRLGRFT
jgi:hypothetical protein